MTVQTVFVSYSGGQRSDKAFAKELLVRIEEQELEPWIYERRGGEVPPGEEIDEFCRKRIRQADHFVAVISDSSLASPHTRSEVEFALGTHGASAIIQIVTTRQAPDKWCEPFSKLVKYKHLPAQRAEQADVERCVEDICHRARVTYRAPGAVVPKLPLLARLTDELRAARPNDPAFEVGLFSQLRTQALDAANAYADGRLEDALGAMTVLIYGLEREFDDQPMYYPRLVRGVVEAELGRRRRNYLAQAEDTFRDVLADTGLDSKRDENALAGLAGVLMIKDEPKEALPLYRKAQEIVTARGEADIDLTHNVLLATMASGDPLSVEDAATLTQWKTGAFLTKDPFLIDRLNTLYALACVYRGDADGAEEALRAVDCANPQIADMIFRLAQELAARIAYTDAHAARLAEKLFAEAVRVSGGTSLGILLGQASFFYEQGQVRRALDILTPLVDRCPDNPKLLVETAWCHFQLRQPELAEARCRRAVGISTAQLKPMTQTELQEFHYFRGFAHWLIGQEELALRDFQDSAFRPEQWYEPIYLRHAVPRAKLTSRVRSLLH